MVFQTLFGPEGQGAVQAIAKDRRFRDDAWQKSTLFSMLAASYVLSRETIMSLIEEVPGLDDLTRAKAHFFMEQFLDLLAPSNSPLLNPQVLQTTLKTRGRNVIKGLKIWMTDVRYGSGLPTQSELGVFEVGRNIAITPGKVVARNHLLELIQYEPKTDKVHAAPILIVPPWINKYYILDLSQGNSYINFLLEQGFSVFTISWKNPDKSMADTTFLDYVDEGVGYALQVVEEITGEANPVGVGYCIGGTLLGITQARRKALGEPAFRALTFFAAMLDFEDPGEVRIFIDERSIRHIERRMHKRGFLRGQEMAKTFAFLRARDLLWSYFVESYLLGNDPRPFDILYWNSDFTRMPAAMHSWYLRNLYLENRLRVPGALVIGDVPIDLGQITEPVYMVGTERDHIAPAHTTFRAHRMMQAPLRFILGSSGHIAGIINPASRNRGYYYTWDEPLQTPAHMSMDDWKVRANKHKGSWWMDHIRWLRESCGPNVTPPSIGSEAHPPIADAPGTYVHEK